MSPAPLAHQFVGLTPQPMNSAANRFGQGAGTSPAIAARAPDGNRLEPRQRHRHAHAPQERPARRLVLAGGWTLRLIEFAHALHSSAVSLSTRLFRNCGLVTMLSTRLPNRSPSAASRVRMLFDGFVVRRYKAASQGVGQQLAAEVVDKLVAPALVEVSPQSVDAISLAAAGKRRARVDGPAAQVDGAELADGPIAFVGQPDRVEPRVAAGAALVGAVAGQRLAQGQVAQLGLVAGEVGDVGRRSRDVLAEQPADDPVASLDRAGPQAGRILGQKHRHGQQPAAPIIGVRRQPVPSRRARTAARASRNAGRGPR